MSINNGQTYYHPYDRHARIVVCRDHADTNRRMLGAVADARLAGPCEVCVEDEARIALGKMAHGRSIPRREVRVAVRDALLERGLIVEQTEGLLDPTPRAAGYCADPNTFDL